MMKLPAWIPGWLAALIGAILAGFMLGRRKRQDAPGAAISAGTIDRAQEVSDEQAESVEAAGRDLAGQLSATPAAKRAGVLRWYRERGAAKRGGGG